MALNYYCMYTHYKFRGNNTHIVPIHITFSADVTVRLIISPLDSYFVETLPKNC